MVARAIGLNGVDGWVGLDERTCDTILILHDTNKWVSIVGMPSRQKRFQLGGAIFRHLFDQRSVFIHEELLRHVARSIVKLSILAIT